MTETTTPTLSDTEREELRLLYSVSVGDIAFFKQQQWTVTNYAIGTYVALVAADKLLAAEPCTWAFWVLGGAVVGAAVAGVGVVRRLQRSIKVRRGRLSAVRSRFSDAFLDAWHQHKDEKDDIHLLLQAVVILGGLLSLVLVVASG